MCVYADGGVVHAMVCRCMGCQGTNKADAQNRPRVKLLALFSPVNNPLLFFWCCDGRGLSKSPILNVIPSSRGEGLRLLESPDEGRVVEEDIDVRGGRGVGG